MPGSEAVGKIAAKVASKEVKGMKGRIHASSANGILSSANGMSASPANGMSASSANGMSASPVNGMSASPVNGMSNPFSGSGQTPFNQEMQQFLNQQLAMQTNYDEFMDFQNMFDTANYNPSPAANSFVDKKNVAHVKWDKALDKTRHGK